MTEFEIGDKVKCKKFGSLEHDFAGEVEKVYENSVLVAIKEFDKQDSLTVTELNQRAIVRKSEAKKTA
ncbi:hypothetical protein FC26_GL002341 [Paucilactobacillus vaccinostercus DSM 20634]|jgi:uncharacterized protein YkvS|uniref:DUF2187 domain-containing protein n=1 Tax=Paucilactobacillus vaccinostercus DSM 20634 TaxID=1423813 RepID=A0A0R2ADX4_9LACO|nr:hypothetical protein [Paucilactobacillus vaccinostercus]KRM61123.1 hypothetical protein FC26_GL002341 [Paucilactobacillus vaccinostercus DSM 20634]RRG08730.1 MAG: DUF2187 domain-containing protein [Lactobacillus sp.]